MLLEVHRDRTDFYGRGAQDVHLDFHTAPDHSSAFIPGDKLISSFSPPLLGATVVVVVICFTLT